MSKSTTPRCKGRRTMWRGNSRGIYGCGRKAVFRVQTRVGMSRTTYVCDGDECWQHVTGGYPVQADRL